MQIRKIKIWKDDKNQQYMIETLYNMVFPARVSVEKFLIAE